MRLSSSVVLAATVAAALIHPAARGDQLDEIRKKGETVFGVLGTDEPNRFVDPKTREIVGYEVDIATAIAKKIGVKPVFKQLAVAARIPELQQGRVDVLATLITHNKEREAQIDFLLTGRDGLLPQRRGLRLRDRRLPRRLARHCRCGGVVPAPPSAAQRG